MIKLTWWLGPVIAACGLSTAQAGHHGGHGGGGAPLVYHHGGRIISPGLLGAGVGYGAYLAPGFIAGPGGGYPWFGSMNSFAPPPPLIFDRGGLLAGPMPNDPLRGLRAQPSPRAKRPDPARATQLVTLGDRLFRAGNTRRAEDRYDQAVKSDPNSAAPHVRLAQLALVRGQYAEAANQLREAQTAEPAWLITATDVQALFSEPTDFAHHIAKLESHLQTEPNDRDAWLLLGAEWFLSGRTRQAADVFLRLSDRQPDSVLSAFLDATTPRDGRRDQ